MKNTLNRILAVCVGLILISCNSGGSGSTPINPDVNIDLSSGSDIVNVPTTVSLILNFTQAVNGVSPTTVQVESPGSTTNVITAPPQQSGNSYTFNLSGLTNATTYTVSISSGITSVATGLSIRANQFSFTTVAANIPTVQITQPQIGSTGAKLNQTVILQFSEAVTGVSLTTLSWTFGNGSVIPFTIESDPIKTTYTLTLPAGTFLNPNTAYTVGVRIGITGTISPSEVPPTTFSFTTINPAIPTVTLTSPTPTTNVSVTPNITLTFSEAVSNVNTNTIKFESLNGQPQPITISASGNSYTLTLPESLGFVTQYVVRVNSGIRSVATAAQVASTQFSFMTRVEGPLTALGTIATGETPYGISISPDGKNVYVTNYFGNSVSQYSRSESGRLTAIGTVATGTNPFGISISRDGKNAYVTNQVSNTLSQYSRDASGILTPLAIRDVATETTPSRIIISPDGNNAYVTNSGSNTVSQYSRDASGIVTLLSTPTVATDSTPFAIRISPDGNNVYVTNYISNTVSQYSRNASGILTALIPSTIATETNPLGLSVSPDGANVYVANSLSGTVSQYSR